MLSDTGADDMDECIDWGGEKYKCIYKCIYIYVFIYVCIYIWNPNLQ